MSSKHLNLVAQRDSRPLSYVISSKEESAKSIEVLESQTVIQGEKMMKPKVDVPNEQACY